MREIVTCLPIFIIEQQGVFALGKSAKAAFPSSDNRSKEILNLIHLDVCGSMSVASVQGAIYHVMFIDDYSRKTYIFFMIPTRRSLVSLRS